MRWLVLALLLSGCSTINVTVSGNNNQLFIEQPKTVATSPTLEASGNTVPVRP